jgi:uncharacterized integral membrane protein
MKKNIGLVLFGVFACIVIALAVTNTAGVTVSIFGAHLAATVGGALIAGFVLGCLATQSLLISGVYAKHESAKRLTEWEAQDQKLLQQVQTDREKQLEAKIATLEAALQRALKK